MSAGSTLMKNAKVVGEENVSLLCETRFEIKPPLSEVIGENYKVQVLDCLGFYDKVLVKGIVEKTLMYKHRHTHLYQSNSAKKQSDVGTEKQNGATNDEKRESIDKSSKKNDDVKSKGSKEKNKDDRTSEHDSFLIWVAKLSGGYVYSDYINEDDDRDNHSESKDKKDNSKDGKDNDGNVKNIYEKGDGDSKNNPNLTKDSVKEEQESKEAKQLAEISEDKKDKEIEEGMFDKPYYMNVLTKRSGLCGGVIHYIQENIEFACVVKMPGVKPNDSYSVELAEVKDYEPLVPALQSQDGLVTEGRQIYVINLTVKATRQEAEHPEKNEEERKDPEVENGNKTEQ